MATPTPDKKPFRIAVMLDQVQFIDIIGIDLLGSLSTSYVSTVAALDPSFAALLPHAVPMEIYFLSTTLQPTGFTLANFRYLPTMTYDACPRDLDLVLTGGPFLSHRPPAAMRFIREAWERTPTWISTCTGSLWLADAGVLDGKRATTNRAFLGAARGLREKVEWVDQRWVVDGKPFVGEGVGEVWTSGGAGAGEFLSFFPVGYLCWGRANREIGLDMVAQFCLQKWDKTLVRTMLDGLELGSDNGRGQFYTNELSVAVNPAEGA